MLVRGKGEGSVNSLSVLCVRKRGGVFCSVNKLVLCVRKGGGSY